MFTYRVRTVDRVPFFNRLSTFGGILGKTVLNKSRDIYCIFNLLSPGPGGKGNIRALGEKSYENMNPSETNILCPLPIVIVAYIEFGLDYRIFH